MVPAQKNGELKDRLGGRFVANLQTAEATPRGWRVASWPPLAWLETAIKAIALVIGIAAGVSALSQGAFAVPGGLRLAQWGILIFLSLGLIAAIFDRIKGREIVAMIFVVANNLGHWGMVLTLAAGASPALLPFAGLMLLGDLAKLLFLKRSGFTVSDVSRSVLYGLTLFYIVGYAAILSLGLFR